MSLSWSEFRMGWILAAFDLPVLETEERKLATRFRKQLLDDGFIMIQYSIYARPCVTHESIEKHAKRIESIAPKTGNIRLIFITDHQWGKIQTISDPHYFREAPEMPEQIAFW